MSFILRFLFLILLTAGFFLLPDKVWKKYPRMIMTGYLFLLAAIFLL